jgi:molybdenum cofactor synthesis domain-containing protein
MAEHDPPRGAIRAAVLTVSDAVSAGRRDDASGPELAAAFERAFHVSVEDRAVVADDRDAIAATLGRWTDRGFDLLLVTGGTGLAPRDRTPEAVRAMIDFEIPGLSEKMRAETGAQFPAAYLSREVAGVRGATIIVALPGSPRGAVDCFRAIAALLPHAVALVKGDRPDHPSAAAKTDQVTDGMS